jgi:hypothetical protein
MFQLPCCIYLIDRKAVNRLETHLVVFLKLPKVHGAKREREGAQMPELAINWKKVMRFSV